MPSLVLLQVYNVGAEWIDLGLASISSACFKSEDESSWAFSNSYVDFQ